MDHIYYRPQPSGQQPLQRAVVMVVIITLVLLAGTFEMVLD
jgi:hypothetical protein